MATLCKKCGMESDRDDTCTWCNADLRRTEPASTAPPTQAHVAASVPEAPQRPAWLIPGIAAASGLVVLVVALIIVGVLASGPPPDEGEWQAFTSKDGSFAALYPTGWDAPQSSGSGNTFVLVVWTATKLCNVTVMGNQRAGAIGDAAAASERAARSGLGAEGVSLEMTADGSLLGYFRETADFVKRRPGYEEGSMRHAYDFASVQSACVEYTYTKRPGRLLRVRMRGVRWASFQGAYGYHAVVEAPEKRWDKFRPMADRILRSIQFGKTSAG